ncbi:hypothetical protein AAMO2058_000186900 [Amorphochlora amoebiformis]
MDRKDARKWLPDRSVMNALVCVLTKMCNENDAEECERPRKTRFHAASIPPITVAEYIDRIAQYSTCSRGCFILALVYIDRIIHVNQDFFVSSFNVHRLLITSVLVAAKYHDDDSLDNGFYADVGGISCEEMNVMELEFLFLLNFSLKVSPDTFRRYSEELKNHSMFATCCSGQDTSPSQSSSAVSRASSTSSKRSDSKESSKSFIYHSKISFHDKSRKSLTESPRRLSSTSVMGTSRRK